MGKIQPLSTPTEKDLGILQEKLLRAVVFSETLPGGDQPLLFPDLHFILSQEIIFLSEDNLASTFNIAEFQMPMRVMSQSDLQQKASLQGDLVYLRFQPPAVEENIVRLTLEMKLIPRNPDQQVLGFGGVQARFQKNSRWEIIEEPILFAM